MPGFEEEAFRRAQQISRPRVVKERAETVREPEKAGLIETLFKDKEKSVILALILLLSDENSDPSLLLALMYLLI